MPGSDREGQKSLWQNGVFTGKVDEASTRAAVSRARPITGSAGSLCLMHTKQLHGSEANRSRNARALFICVYPSADAVPLTHSPLPNCFEGRIVRAKASRFARMDPGTVELPPAYRAASFFEIQEQGGACYEENPKRPASKAEKMARGSRRQKALPLYR